MRPVRACHRRSTFFGGSMLPRPQIAPATGKLGVLLPGLGAVATTFIAGTAAVRRGLGKPIGSLTQMGTIRLGKRTDSRAPAIRDFVPLARLEDLVCGGWDIFPDDCYRSARNAGVLEPALLEQVRADLEAVRPMPAVFDRNYVRKRSEERRVGTERGATCGEVR